MATRKSFSTATNKKPIEFDIDGQVFKCHPQMAAGMLMRFAEVLGDDSNGEELTPAEQSAKGKEQITVLRDYFHSALLPEYHADWDHLLNDPNIAISVDTLTEIAAYLAEEYSGGRPTDSASPRKQRKKGSGRTSTAGHSPTVTTYSRPTPVDSST